MTEQDFKDLVAPGRESASLEAKAGGSRDDEVLRARVVRAALGMANHEGGGWIVVGVAEGSDGTFELAGVPQEHLATWNHDDVSAVINGVADPHIALEADTVATDGRSFVVIRVHEFVDVPVVARQNGPTPKGEKSQIYKKGACYARSRRKPETIEALSDPTTWRTLIELASKKGAARILQTIGVGACVGQHAPNDHEQFAAQIGDLR